MKKLTLFFIIFLAFTFIFGTPHVLAQQEGSPTIGLTNPLEESGANTIGDVLSRIIDGLQVIATPIAGIMVLVGGFQILFAAGDPEKFKKGKKTILYTVIGYAIILVANGMDELIKNILTHSVE
ncbi:MAG TPA: pilin [Candidatus Paceibacterota bacterium]|nr:pilin [Candidatus Paceibacterota bacterium]